MLNVLPAIAKPFFGASVKSYVTHACAEKIALMNPHLLLYHFEPAPKLVFKKSGLLFLDSSSSVEKTAQVTKDFFDIRDHFFNGFCKAAMTQENFCGIEWSLEKQYFGITLQGTFKGFENTLSPNDQGSILKRLGKEDVRSVELMAVLPQQDLILKASLDIENIKNSNSMALKAFFNHKEMDYLRIISRLGDYAIYYK